MTQKILITFLQWIVIYPQDSTIQPLNNWGQDKRVFFFFNFLSWFSTEDMHIRKEITVSYQELLSLNEEYVKDLQPDQMV